MYCVLQVPFRIVIFGHSMVCGFTAVASVVELTVLFKNLITTSCAFMLLPINSSKNMTLFVAGRSNGKPIGRASGYFL